MRIVLIKITCPECQGTGEIDDKICEYCGGDGYVEEMKGDQDEFNINN